jgi:hypothetical protein
VYRGRLAELKTPDEQACVQQMTQALQALIESKGW